MFRSVCFITLSNKDYSMSSKIKGWTGKIPLENLSLSAAFCKKLGVFYHFILHILQPFLPTTDRIICSRGVFWAPKSKILEGYRLTLNSAENFLNLKCLFWEDELFPLTIKKKKKKSIQLIFIRFKMDQLKNLRLEAPTEKYWLYDVPLPSTKLS